MFQPAPVLNTAERFTHTGYAFFTATLTVGLLSMALIQVLKDLLPVRRWFQRAWVRCWLMQRQSLARTKSPSGSLDELEEHLVQLATDGDRSSFYNLPIEQLCGQLNAAAQSILEHPEKHQDLLSYLASNADPADFRKVVDCSANYREKAGKKLDEQERPDFTDCVDARNRVAHHVQRAIDALQLSAGDRWKLWIQILSIALSGIIAFVGISFFGEIPDPWKRLEAIFAIAILGGFLAPVARDLIAGLQSLRK